MMIDDPVDDFGLKTANILCIKKVFSQERRVIYTCLHNSCMEG